MVELKMINEANYQAVCALEVTSEQKSQNIISENADSIAEGRALPKVARPFAIYADHHVVGFTMFAFDEERDEFWLWRLMIDKEFQGKGYGKAVMPVIIDYFKNEGVQILKLSTKPENHLALKLYKDYGFVETGQRLEQEVELVLRLV
ncbi:GNAT family N-acetyltransferase [Vagococcus sp. BWB3-3]|uniref:GNAT family N-acetyltransferase n=1 Tax=Vagococcus allomyrinae TaxID=2794353 RepID=A0A940PCC9_9ENTE|nr:GNAT family N-acetyltransferase [Vagococcus allomyrinae]MBP1041403.1 GNAT family N-acetyltransferase [Vagococcus allomyrinae]